MYKVLTTVQPAYLYEFISVQPPGRTRSSFVITFARPPLSSSLKITDRSCRHASPCLCNQLPASFRQPRSNHSPSYSSFHSSSLTCFIITILTIHHSHSLPFQTQTTPFPQILSNPSPTHRTAFMDSVGYFSTVLFWFFRCIFVRRVCKRLN